MDFNDAVHLTNSGPLSVKHERVAEIIRDLDPTLELVYIPEDTRTAFDKHPFAVRHSPVGMPSYIIMTLAENEVDERVIARLIKHDTHRGNVLDELEASNTAHQMMLAKARMDEAEEQRDFVESVIKSKKNWYRHDGQVYT